MIELMPGHTEETVAAIEARVRKAQPISKRILEGATAEDLVKDYLGDFELLELDHPYPIKYHCRCTYERVLRSVMLLGIQEIESAIEEKKPLDVDCEFCGRRYHVTEEDLGKLRNDLHKISLN